jgi:hypothetical protein
MNTPFVAEVKQMSFSEWVNEELDTILRMPIGKTQNDRIAQLQRDVDYHFEALGPQASSEPGFQVYFQVGIKGMLLGDARFPVRQSVEGTQQPFCEYPHCRLHNETSPVAEIVVEDFGSGVRRRILRKQCALQLLSRPPVKIWLCEDCSASSDVTERLIAALAAKVLDGHSHG